MVKKVLKKLISMGCAAALLMMSPGTMLLADEIWKEEVAISDTNMTESVDETMQREGHRGYSDEESVPETDYSTSVQTDIDYATDEISLEETNEDFGEGVLGAGDIVVGEGVTATYDPYTRSIVFYSDDGILNKDWAKTLDTALNFDVHYNIESIRCDSGRLYLPEDSSYIFAELYDLTNLNLNGFDTSNVTKMDYMFFGCFQLTNLDLSNFDTSNVTNMENMFRGCSSLTNLNLSSFETLNVTNMCDMFAECSSLTDLDLSCFVPSSVTVLRGMFYGCSSLTTLNLSNFNTPKVTSMDEMFSGCSSLTNLDMSSFDTSKVTSMGGMFCGCSSLTDLDMSSFDTSNVTSMIGMFCDCSSLTSLDLSRFDMSSVIDMDYSIGLGMSLMFSGCSSLINLDLSNFDTSRVMSLENMFSGCSRLTNLNMSSFDTSKVTSMGGMFCGCSSLTSLDLSRFDTSKVTYMSEMFSGCSSLTNLDISSFDTSEVTSMHGMFSNCSGLTRLNLNNFNTSKVMSMGRMFYGCSSLTDLDLSSFDNSNIKEKYYMAECLRGCTNLQFLKTPSNNTVDVDLPVTMYDSAGKAYNKLPIQPCTITLTRDNPNESISSSTISLFPSVCTYDGSLQEPAVTVTIGTNTLIPVRDYSVAYSDNLNSGVAMVTVTGKGTYKGEKSVSFTINKAEPRLNFAETYIYKTTLDEPFTNNLTAITDGKMYFSSSNSKVITVDSISGLVTITGTGTATVTADVSAGRNYDAGSISYTVTVADGRTDLSECIISLSANNYVYDGKAKEPSVTVKDGKTTLELNTDYTISYVNNTNAGTASVKVSGKGKYKGEQSAGFTITKAIPSLSFAENIVLKSTIEGTFTNALSISTDGNVTYTSDNLDVAVVDSITGLVTIKSAGMVTISATVSEGKNYEAGKTAYALLVSAVNIENASVAGVSLSYGYSGKAYTPALTVKVNGVELIKETDYTVKYENNSAPGTAIITITGRGKYTGTRIKTFEIVDCVSKIVSGKTYQLIPKNNSKTAVCSYSGKMVNNTKVYITDRSNSEAMKFKAVKNSDGTWKFINAKCELALAVQQNSSAVGAGLVLYDQTTKPAQNWKLSKKSDNSFAVINAVTGYSIAMSDSSAVKGTTLSMDETASSGLQRFYIAEASAVSAPFDGTKSVRASKDKSFSLNIASSSKEDGANMNLYSFSNTNAKKFKVMYSGGGYYRLVNVNSGLCLTVSGNTKTDGANIIQSKWAAQSGQRWKITKNSDGTVTLTNALGTVLHLSGNKTANNTNVQARKASTTGAQKWYLQ